MLRRVKIRRGGTGMGMGMGMVGGTRNMRANQNVNVRRATTSHLQLLPSHSHSCFVAGYRYGYPGIGGGEVEESFSTHRHPLKDEGRGRGYHHHHHQRRMYGSGSDNSNGFMSEFMTSQDMNINHTSSFKKDKYFSTSTTTTDGNGNGNTRRPRRQPSSSSPTSSNPLHPHSHSHPHSSNHIKFHLPPIPRHPNQRGDQPITMQDKERHMKRIAVQLLSLRDPHIYASFLNTDFEEEEDNNNDVHVDDDDDEYLDEMEMNHQRRRRRRRDERLLFHTRKVISYYANPNRFLSLTSLTAQNTDHAYVGDGLVLMGPQLCHDLLKSVILPHFSTKTKNNIHYDDDDDDEDDDDEEVMFSSRVVDHLIDMSYFTITSLGKLAVEMEKQNRNRNRHNATRNGHGNGHGSGNGMRRTSSAHSHSHQYAQAAFGSHMQLGELAEELLRLVLNAPFQPVPMSITLSDPDHDKETYHKERYNSTPSMPHSPKKRLQRLEHLYNTTLQTWSTIAMIEKDPMVAKDAAYRAERLLLDLAESKRNDGTTTQHDTVGAATGAGASNKFSLLQFIQPDVISFNTVINAWGRSGRYTFIKGGGAPGERGYGRERVDVTTVAAAERAEAILNLLQEMYDASVSSSMRTGTRTSNSASSSNQHGRDGNDSKYHDGFDDEYNDDDIIDDEFDNDVTDDPTIILPNRESYEIVINAWSKAMDHNAPHRAMRLLEDMLERYYMAHANAKTHFRAPPPFPSHRTFSVVLKAWANYGNHGISTTNANEVSSSSSSSSSSSLTMEERHDAIRQAESLFAHMKRLNDIGYVQNRPDTIAHNSLFSVYANQISNLIRGSSSGGGGGGTSSSRRYQGRQRRHTIISKEELKQAFQLSKRMDEILEEMIEQANKRKDDSKNLTKDTAEPDDLTYKTILRSHLDLGKALLGRPQELDMLQRCVKQAKVLIMEQYLSKELMSKTPNTVRRGQSVTRMEIVQLLSDLMVLSIAAKDPLSAIEVLNFAIESPHLNIDTFGYERLLEILLTPTKSMGMKKRAQVSPVILDSTEDILHNMRGRGIILTTRMYNYLIDALAHSSSSHHSAAKKADAIMQQMLDEYTVALEDISNGGENSRIARPNTHSLHMVLSAYDGAITSRQLPKRDEDVKYAVHRMEEILRVMQEMQHRYQIREADEVRVSTFLTRVAPNIISYNILLKAYNILARNQGCVEDKYNLFSKAYTLVENLEDSYQNGKNPDAKPDKETYSLLSKLLAKSCSKSTEIEDLHQRIPNIFDSEREIKPEVHRYNFVISSWANVGTIEACEQAERLLDRLMFDDSIEPDDASFAAVLRGFALGNGADSPSARDRILQKKEDYQKEKRSHHMSVNTLDYFDAIKKYGDVNDADGSFRLLQRLVRTLKDSESKSDKKYLAFACNEVMKNFSNAKEETSLSRVQEVFDMMNEEEFIEPDHYTYSTLMDAYAESRLPTSVPTVNAILDSILDKDKPGNENIQTSIHFFNILFKACALSPPSSDAIPATVAIQRFSQIHRSNPWGIEKLSPSSYNHLLAISEKHIQRETQRRELVKQIFRKCCSDGKVTSDLMRRCQALLSQELFAKILSEMPGADEGHKKLRQQIPGSVRFRDLPAKWTRHAYAPKPKKKTR